MSANQHAAGRAAEHGGVVVQLPARRPVDERLDTRDRIALLAWADGPAREAGIVRVAVEHEEAVQPTDPSGDYVLLYRAGSAWSAWGLTRSGGRYQLWEAARGRTLGIYAALADALADAESESRRLNPSSTDHPQVAPAVAEQADVAPDEAATARRLAAG